MRKLPWLDRIGIGAALAAVFVIAFLWWTGWAGITALLVALLVTALFTFILVWAANRVDDNPDNDDAMSALTDIRTDAQRRWDELLARGGGDAPKS